MPTSSSISGKEVEGSCKMNSAKLCIPNFRGGGGLLVGEMYQCTQIWTDLNWGGEGGGAVTVHKNTDAQKSKRIDSSPGSCETVRLKSPQYEPLTRITQRTSL